MHFLTSLAAKFPCSLAACLLAFSCFFFLHWPLHTTRSLARFCRCPRLHSAHTTELERLEASVDLWDMGWGARGPGGKGGSAAKAQRRRDITGPMMERFRFELAFNSGLSFLLSRSVGTNVKVSRRTVIAFVPLRFILCQLSFLSARPSTGVVEGRREVWGGRGRGLEEGRLTKKRYRRVVQAMNTVWRSRGCTRFQPRLGISFCSNHQPPPNTHP